MQLVASGPAGVGCLIGEAIELLPPIPDDAGDVLASVVEAIAGAPAGAIERGAAAAGDIIADALPLVVEVASATVKIIG